VKSSPYLLGICLFLLLYTVTSTLLYFEQARIVRESLPAAADRTAFFAQMDLMVNLLAATTQALLTGRILLLLGVGATLAILPTLTLAGLAALSFAPSLVTIACVQVIRRAAEFALIRPARELLFTTVSREEKYVSKSFIDTFVYRGGDAVGAWLDRLLGVLGVGLAAVTAAFAPFAAAWVLLAVLLGRYHTTVARSPLAAGPGQGEGLGAAPSTPSSR
jgi:AAA family ATP:ADP antiporter